MMSKMTSCMCDAKQRAPYHGLRGIIAAVSLALLASCRDAAPMRMIADQPTCKSCVVHVTRITTLGDQKHGGFFTTIPLHVASNRQGDYLVFDSEVPQVFDADGNFIASIGRTGHGPGELQGPALPFEVGGDSILVVQPLARRAAVYTPQFQYARSIQLPGLFGRYVQVWHWPDSVLMVGSISTRERYGYPLHLLSLTGATAVVAQSGGPDEVRMDERSYVPAFGPNHTTWLAQLGSYDLTLWDAAFRQQGAISRAPDWWSHEYRPAGTPQSPPTPVIERMLTDGDLLWVFIRVAGDEWQKGWPRVAADAVRDKTGHLPISSGEMAFDKLYATVIEVIDLRTRRVLTRKRLPYPVMHVLSGRRIVGYTPASDGTPVLTVFHVQLTR